jgi:hypothetical protein
MDGLVKDWLSKPRLNGVGQDQVHRAAEKAFQVRLQVHIGVKGFVVKLH